MSSTTMSTSALGKLTTVETKLFLREPAGPLVVIGIPLALLLVFGLMPGMREASPDFGGKSPLATFIAPMAIAILLSVLAMNVLPSAIAGYREKGVLRRFAASPAPPSRLLAAQLLVNLGAALVVVLIVVGVGSVALGMALPGNVPGFVLSLVLGTVSLFSVGLLVAALAPTGRSAGGIGYIVFFPMLALGGVWVPKEQLPDVLQKIADVLPLGGTLNALRATWAGAAPETLQLIALAVVAVICGTLAARFFRWE
jgi:ABC-2 type transport system permease protein